jgi:hypothetical protein
MPHSKAKIVRIEESHPRARLSPAQKKFNATLKKIDVQKKLLAEWQAVIPQCRQENAAKLDPLKQTLSEHQVEMAEYLDHLYKTQKFSRNQQEKIAYLISEICAELIKLHGRDDLKPLYNQYSGSDFDTEAREGDAMQGDFLKAILEQEFGVTLDDDEFDLSNPEAMAERLAEKVQEQQRQAEERRPQRKKTAKQLEKEAREQEEAAKISKSIQAVYRQLVAALHPDREQDPAERDRKTELMQKVTVAYGKKDLLQLLELQLSVEQIDQNNLNNIAADRLKHYNKVLENHLQELLEEVMLVEVGLKGMMGIAPFEHLSPKRLVMLLKQDIRTVQEEIARIQHDLRIFKDVKQFKLWLKSYRIPTQEYDPFFDEAFTSFGFK